MIGSSFLSKQAHLIAPLLLNMNQKTIRQLITHSQR